MKKYPILTWDESELAESRLGWYKEMALDTGENPDDITIEDIYNDPFYWEAEHSKVCEDLTELMKGREYWKIEGSDMGWHKLLGHKYVNCSNGKELLQAILPNTDTIWSLYRLGKGFAMRVSHHDAPTGEHYILKPIAQSTYEKNY